MDYWKKKKKTNFYFIESYIYSLAQNMKWFMVLVGFCFTEFIDLYQNMKLL